MTRRDDPLERLTDLGAELLHALREARRTESLSAQRAARRAEERFDKMITRLIAEREGLFSDT